MVPTYIYTPKKGKVCFEITGWGQPLVRAEKQGFSAGASFWADLNCPPCSTNAEISLQHFFSFKIAGWVWKYCMIWEGGEEVGKTAFYSLHKCCLFSCNKPVKLEVANERESQGSLLNSASALDSVLSLAKQSLDFNDLGFLSPDQLPSTQWAGSVCDQSNLKSVNMICLIWCVDWESLRILNPHLLFILQCSALSSMRRIWLIHSGKL